MRVLDAEAIDLADASVDRVVCRFALMLIPDPRRRSARRGGCCDPAAGSRSRCGTRSSDNPWAPTLWDVLERMTDLPPARPGGPGMFALADRGPARATLLAGAGLG